MKLGTGFFELFYEDQNKRVNKPQASKGVPVSVLEL
jgi:hypothetical protein